MTSSTRRNHWLALIKEIILLHRFLRKFKVDSPSGSWEMHARTILGIIRLHAAREMLRISPPVPKKFLIFDLLDELPKGDYVLEELAGSLKKVDVGHPCSASSILRSLNVSQMFVPSVELKEIQKDINDVPTSPVQVDHVSSLGSAIDQSREEAKEIQKAKATVEDLKDEGIGNSVQVLMVGCYAASIEVLFTSVVQLVFLIEEFQYVSVPLCSISVVLKYVLFFLRVCLNH